MRKHLSNSTSSNSIENEFMLLVTVGHCFGFVIQSICSHPLGRWLDGNSRKGIRNKNIVGSFDAFEGWRGLLLQNITPAAKALWIQVVIGEVFMVRQ